MCFLRRIVSAIREPGVVPANFAVGVKLNAADYVHSGTEERDDLADEQRVLGHLREIASWQTVDFIEVSGGNYENPGKLNPMPCKLHS